MVNTSAKTLPTPQVSAGVYTKGSYDDQRRWSSYWYQIEFMKRASADRPMLEIGIGGGLVSTYFRSVLGREIVTVDIDPELRPDFVADIIDLPFEKNSFSVVAACEVLEHMPFERSARALQEMRRVASSAVISIPNCTFAFAGRMAIIQRAKSIVITQPFGPRRVESKIANHYWEIGLRDYPMERVEEIIALAGWRIETTLRNPLNVFHQFFVLQ